jgi:hypothetical protein
MENVDLKGISKIRTQGSNSKDVLENSKGIFLIVK